MAVYERPDNYTVRPPPSVDTTLTPFSAFESPGAPDAAAAGAPQPASGEHTRNCPLIVVNTPLDSIDVRALWAAAPVQVCADGGANTLYHHFPAALRAQYVPTFITGDCDSLHDHVRDYYVARGAVLVPQSSQYATDFMKAVKLVVIASTRGGGAALAQMPRMADYSDHVGRLADAAVARMDRAVTVNVAGGIGGRFDQTFHSINQLYVMRTTHPWLQVYFFTAQDVVFLLPRGTTRVRYRDRSVFNTVDPVPKCGLLPFRGRLQLTSEGLQYDVEDWTSGVGGEVSSSNGVVGVDGFWVKSSEDIVMNIEMGKSAK